MENKSKVNKNTTVSTNSNPQTTKLDPSTFEVIKQEEFKLLDEKNPVAICLFSIVCIVIVLSLIVLFGISSSAFPWKGLLITSVVLATLIGMYLWGYYSRKPGTVIQIRYVVVPQAQGKKKKKSQQQPPKTTQHPQPEQPKKHIPMNPKVNLNAIYEDEDFKGVPVSPEDQV